MILEYVISCVQCGYLNFSISTAITRQCAKKFETFLICKMKKKTTPINCLLLENGALTSARTVWFQDILGFSKWSPFKHFFSNMKINHQYCIHNYASWQNENQWLICACYHYICFIDVVVSCASCKHTGTHNNEHVSVVRNTM